MGMQNVIATLKTVWQFITKLNMVLPYDPGNTLQSIYKTYLKTYVHTYKKKKNLHMNVYSNFIHNHQNLEVLRCSSIGEWINKIHHVCTMEYYSVIKI